MGQNGKSTFTDIMKTIIWQLNRRIISYFSLKINELWRYDDEFFQKNPTILIVKYDFPEEKVWVNYTMVANRFLSAPVRTKSYLINRYGKKKSITNDQMYILTLENRNRKLIRTFSWIYQGEGEREDVEWYQIVGTHIVTLKCTSR